MTAKSRAIWDHGNMAGRAEQAKLLLVRVVDSDTATPRAKQMALDLVDQITALREELRTIDLSSFSRPNGQDSTS